MASQSPTTTIQTLPSDQQKQQQEFEGIINSEKNSRSIQFNIKKIQWISKMISIIIIQ
jgi:hypothetical protein